MDDISRELLQDSTGATPVSERQKGPEEFARFERERVDESLAGGLPGGDRLAGLLGRATFADEATADAVPAAEDRLMEDPAADGGVPAEDDAPELGGAQEQSQAPDSADAPEGAAPAEPETGAITEGGLPDSDNVGSDDIDSDDIDSDEALAAVAAEAETAEIEEVLGGDEDGLPSVPELQDPAEVARIVCVLMLTSREGLSILRLAQACNTSQKLVEQGLDLLAAQFAELGLPVELSRVGDSVRWVSSASAFAYLQRLRGVKKMEKLSPAALETLAVVAYRQPVMRSEIEAIRGVKAGPMLRTLLQHKLIRVAGRADVPGRPLQYGTTQHFLERFGIASLQELPSVKEWKNLG